MIDLETYPTECWLMILSYIQLTELMGTLSLVCKRWCELCRAVAHKRAHTLVLCSSLDGRYVRKVAPFATPTSEFVFFNIPMHSARTMNTLYRSFESLDQCTDLVARLGNVKQLVIYCDFLAKRVTDTKFEFIIEPKDVQALLSLCRDKLTHLKLLIDDEAGTIMWSDMWKAIEDSDLSALHHLTIYTHNRLSMVNSGQVMSQLKEFNHGQKNIRSLLDTYTVLAPLSDEKCQSIGIYQRHKQQEVLKQDLIRLRRDRPVLWAKVSRINEPNIDPRLFEPLVTCLKMSTIKFLQLHLHKNEDFDVYQGLIAQCSSLKQLFCVINSDNSYESLFAFIEANNKLSKTTQGPLVKSIKVYTKEARKVYIRWPVWRLGQSMS